MQTTLAAADLSEDVFVQVAAILIVSVIAGTAAVWLRLPVVIAYVAVGVAVGRASPAWSSQAASSSSSPSWASRCCSSSSG